MSPVPLIPNGVYKIRSDEFSSHVADLSGGDTIVAGMDWEGNPREKWIIQNHGDGGNQITIENAHVRGSFADARGQHVGAPLVGSLHSKLWTVVKLDQGTFYIQTVDGQYVWELPQGVNGEPIVLSHHSGQRKQKWLFDKVYE